MTIRLSGPVSPFANGHWDFPEQLGNGVGFVYAIFDKVQHKGYIGRKNFKISSGFRKGASANWREYCSSSPTLEAHMARRSKADFEFIALEQYSSLASLGYAETFSQVMAGVACTPNWLNTRIEEVSWPVTEPVTKRHIERLKSVMARVPGSAPWGL